MSGQGFPFQADALAFARWDYCQAPEAVPEFSDPLTCTLRARQCGSHIAATRDRRWLAQATAPLSGLLQPATVTGWAGGPGCVDAEAGGVCNLLTSDRYGPAFWTSAGRARAAAADRAVAHARFGVPPREDDDGPVALAPPVFGSLSWLAQHYR